MVGLARKSVNSWKGVFTNLVSCHKSGVRKAYVWSKHSNVACRKRACP